MDNERLGRLAKSIVEYETVLGKNFITRALINSSTYVPINRSEEVIDKVLEDLFCKNKSDDFWEQVKDMSDEEVENLEYSDDEENMFGVDEKLQILADWYCKQKGYKPVPIKEVFIHSNTQNIFFDYNKNVIAFNVLHDSTAFNKALNLLSYVEIANIYNKIPEFFTNSNNVSEPERFLIANMLANIMVGEVSSHEKLLDLKNQFKKHKDIFDIDSIIRSCDSITEFLKEKDFFCSRDLQKQLNVINYRSHLMFSETLYNSLTKTTIWRHELYEDSVKNGQVFDEDSIYLALSDALDENVSSYLHDREIYVGMSKPLDDSIDSIEKISDYHIYLDPMTKQKSWYFVLPNNYKWIGNPLPEKVQ